jgi:hypothetical protein
MDHFIEEAVKKRNGGFDMVLYYFSFVVMVLSGITALLQLSSLWGYFARGQASFADLLPALLIGLAMAGVAVGIYFTRDRLRTEYEYTFTSGSLDFAQVFNNKKRKNLGTLNVRTVDAFGPVDGQAFQRYVNMPEVKQTRWFLNRDGNLHFFYFQKEGSKRLIILEPSEEMVKTIRFYLPRGAWQE